MRAAAAHAYTGLRPGSVTPHCCPPSHQVLPHPSHQVRLPLSSLGPQRPVYLGKSIEGILRHRRVNELKSLFRYGYVCIRRFRSTDGRLLPLVLDGPRLLKYHAMPSEVALQVR